MRLNLKNAIGVSAVVMLIITSFTSSYLDNNYVSYPRIPNQESGRTLGYRVKGVVVYISQEQWNILQWVHCLEIGSWFAIGLAIIMRE